MAQLKSEILLNDLKAIPEMYQTESLFRLQYRLQLEVNEFYQKEAEKESLYLEHLLGITVKNEFVHRRIKEITKSIEECRSKIVE